MRYHLKERVWTLTNDFTVRDDRGQAIFDIHGKFFHIGDNLKLIDHMTGQELVQIKQRLISLRPRYDIFRQGAHWAEIHEQFRFFGERFKVTGENGMVFHVDGDIWNWNFGIEDDAGNLMGNVSRQLSLFRDSYAVDVAPGVDAPFIVALALVLELVKEHRSEDAAL